MQSDNRFHDSSPLPAPPSFIQRLRSSLCSSCCFGGGAGDDDEVDLRPASPIGSSTTWLRSRAQELQEIRGRCRNLVARVAPRHPHHHARRGSGDFGYDPLSYALNFDDGPDDHHDDDDRLPGGGNAYRYRNFSSRLPPSPPRPAIAVASLRVVTPLVRRWPKANKEHSQENSLSWLGNRVGGKRVSRGWAFWFFNRTVQNQLYQLDLCKRAVGENIIVYLGTGCGKTHIAVLLMYELGHLIRNPSKSICIFLAPTVPLVRQVCASACCSFLIFFLVLVMSTGANVTMASLAASAVAGSFSGPYRPVYTGLTADRYVDRPLPGGIAKIDHRRLISVVDGRLKEKSTVDGRLRKKREEEEEEEKKKEEEEKKKEEEEKEKKEEDEKYLARVPSLPVGDFSPRTGREIEV
ncbi:hypothetical protein BHM03_00045658, partial [Ensete ventricosum]